MIVYILAGALIIGGIAGLYLLNRKKKHEDDIYPFW